MSLHRVLADEQPSSHLLVAEALGNQLQDLELARGDAERIDAALVGDERTGRYLHLNGHRHLDLLGDDDPSGERQTKPDAGGGKHGGDERRVNFERVLDDEKAVLDEAHGDYQEPAA